MLLILYLRFHHEHLWTGVGGSQATQGLEPLVLPSSRRPAASILL